MTHIHTHIHAHIHAHIHTHSHTFTHIHSDLSQHVEIHKANEEGVRLPITTSGEEDSRGGGVEMMNAEVRRRAWALRIRVDGREKCEDRSGHISSKISQSKIYESSNSPSNKWTVNKNANGMYLHNVSCKLTV